MTRAGWWLTALLLWAFCLRLGYGLARPPQTLRDADVDHYAAIAGSFSETGTLMLDGKPTAMREPAYPVYLGALFKVFGRSYPVVLAGNCLLAVLALLFLFLVGRDLFGPETAFLALAVGTVYPAFVFYAAEPVRETALLAVSALGLWALVRALGRPGGAAFAGAGAAQALACLTTTVFLPFSLGLAPPLILLLCRDRLRDALRWTAIYVGVFALLYCPWLIRNQLVFHRFIPGTSISASAILYSYLIVPQELGGTPQEAALLVADPVYRAISLGDPDRRDALFARAAAERIRRNPWSYARLATWRLFIDQWRFCPRPRTDPGTHRLRWWLSLLSNGWIIPLGFLGLLLSRGRPARASVLYLFVLAVSLVYSAILTMLRYRTPLMPWMILYACLALRLLWSRRTSVLGPG